MKSARMLAILSFFILSFTGTNALAQKFTAGDKIISLGVSTLPYIKIKGTGSQKILPVSMSFTYITL